MNEQRTNKIKAGDKIQIGTKLQDGTIYWGTIQTVKWINSEGLPMYRPKWGKVNKIAYHWRIPRGRGKDGDS